MGTPGKYNFLWGLLWGFEQLFYPAGGGNEGQGLISVTSCTPGKTGDFVKEKFNFKLSYINNRKTAVQKNADSLSPRGSEKWRRALAQAGLETNGSSHAKINV